MSPEQQAGVIKGLRGGASREEAAGFAGVSVMALEETLRLGRIDPDSSEAAFRHAVLQAEEGAKVAAASVVIQAAKLGDWKAAAWWLERRAPDQWTKGGKVDMTQFIRIDELVRILTKLGKTLHEVIPDTATREKITTTLTHILQEALRAA